MLVLPQSMCAVPSVAVSCSTLMSCFPGMLLRYFLNDFEMVPVALIIIFIALFLHSTCSVFVQQSLYILESSQLLS